MERELELPDVGEGIAEGEIVRWLVEPGDQVTEDQPLAEVETDKAVVEVPSPTDGTVTQLHAEEGEIVAVGSVIVTFEVGDGGEATGAVESGAAESGVSEAADADETGTGTTGSEPAEPAGTVEAAGADGAESTAGAQSVPANQVIAPPRVKRRARELGVAIGSIDGAGDGTPITETDVRRAAGRATEPAADGEATAAAKPAPAASSTQDGAGSSAAAGTGAGTGTQQQTTQASTTAAEPADREKTLAAPATRQLARELDVDIDRVPASEERDGQAFVTPEDVRAFAEGGTETAGTGRATAGAGAATAAGTDGRVTETGEREQRIPYRGVRRTIGKQMAKSKYTAPHVSHHDSVEVTELVETRQKLKAEVGEDVSLTYLPFVMKAIVAGLKEHPEINATLDEEAGEIVQKRYYNIGVATATEAGLMVPVVKNVDGKGIVQLARETVEVVDRARSRDISPEEMQGGTFTITNFGTIGGEYATPIINFPEAAILGLGAIKERPVVEDGEVVARTTLPLSMTVDHRLIDGAEAAAFVNDVKRHLNNPSLLML